MNYANPILICDENEEFRILIRDMLTKNGFFHVLEASDANETATMLSDRKDYFVIVESKLLSEEMIQKLGSKKSFIVFADNSDPKTIILATKLGVNHIMTYPFHSKKLLDKINSLIQ